MKQTVAIAISLLALAGCLSAPKLKYHTLDLAPPAAVEPLPINLVIDQLRAAEPLRREGIMIQKTRTEIEYYAEHLWAAALAEQVAQKLEGEFGPSDPDKPTVMIFGEILAFEQLDAEGGPKVNVRLDLQYRLEDASRYQKPLLQKVYGNDPGAEAAVSRTDAPVESTVSAVVQALSDRLRDLAPLIRTDAVQAYQRWQQNQAPESGTSG